MRMARPAGIVALAVAALVAAGCGSSSNNASPSTSTTSESSTSTTTANGTTLDATVGPGFTISLTGADGKAVKTLTAGTYTINVDDKSDIHNFHLTGAGVDKTTDVSGTGTETWTVDLKAGTYHFQCDPHAATMNGSFTVT
jgi:hypothetical protein